jgi:hypothetical protein
VRDRDLSRELILRARGTERSETGDIVGGADSLFARKLRSSCARRGERDGPSFGVVEQGVAAEAAV